VSATSWVRAPIGPEAARWTTVPIERTVLVIVHTITSANRLADILPVFESDSRVQIVFTAIGASAISEGVVDALTNLGGIVIPWDQAVQTNFDLAMSVNHSGELWKIAAPLAILSHGIGYTKYSAESRHPPHQHSLSREPGAGYGMSPEWLLHDGRPFADALVFSHDEQLARLAAVVPEALSTAVVAGDPCFDRLRVSLPLRQRYRRRLQAAHTTTVVTISSTWGPQSLLGSWPSLVRELLSELPIDSYRVLFVAHPNVWYAHGPWQLRSWLADATRAGLTVIDPLAGWQQAVLASDVLIGDHGAVTGYAAALGIPTLLATARSADVIDGTAIDMLARTAPRLDPHRPLREQVHAAMDGNQPERSRAVADLISATPDQSAHQLRTLFYRLLSLPEPATDPILHPYPSSDLPADRPPAAATLVQGIVEPDSNPTHIRLHRLPADVLHHRSALLPPLDGHLVVHADHPLRTLRAEAGILYCNRDEAGTDEQAWLSETFQRWPASVLTAIINPNSCTVYGGTNRTAKVSSSGSTNPTPLLFASAIYLWLSDGNSWDDLPTQISIDTDSDTPAILASVHR